MASNYYGTMEDVSTISLNTNYNRAVFISALNAVMSELKMAEHTIHCKDEGPKKCRLDLVEMIQKKYGTPNIALLGLQRAGGSFGSTMCNNSIVNFLNLTKPVIYSGQLLLAQQHFQD